METSFVFILIFLFFHRLGTSSNAVMRISSNVTCIEKELESLLIFKRSLRDRSNRLSTWTGVECCEWQGIKCDIRNGHVVKLNLRTPVSITSRIYTDNLGGELSPSLLNLNNLRYLDLSVNNFSGQIPEFLGSFKFLKYLNLSCSGFGGVVPRHLGNLSRLQYLDLSTYYGESLFLNDDLSWVSSLSSLKYLDLSGTSIGDSIDWLQPVNTLPSLITLNLASCYLNVQSINFVNFTSLNSLDLSSNNMDSTIPVWLSNLTNLMHLNLENNYFHGRIPDVIGTLSSLASIDLSSNSFNTSFPDLLWNLSSLVHLDLSSNNFHGPVPRNVKLCRLSFLNFEFNRFAGDFSSFIGNLSDCLINIIKDLNLNNNHFKGRIPKKFGDFKKLEHLHLTGNQLSGPLPSSLSSMLSLKEMDVSNNKLNGSIPASFGQLLMLEKLDLSSNQLSGNIPLSFGQFSNLDTLDVSSNSLDGNLSETHFTKMNNLTILRLHSNYLALNVSSGWIPPFQLQQLYGSSCNIGPHFPNWLHTQTDLQILDLSNTGIEDMLPEWFVNISSHIYDLDLSSNQICGKLPRFHAFSNLQPFNRLVLRSNKFEGSFTSFPSNLHQLDLSDNFLSGHLPQTDETMNSVLEFVNLSKNNFTGSLQHFCNVFSIEVLDLSHNKFSGKLPGCLGNLYRLLMIDLSHNSITGVVPSSLGSLNNLQSLHLHNNRLKGDLPESLQNLASLLTMDLGSNLLTGAIPFWIGENMTNLGMLNLQSNKFIGKIPLQLCQLQVLQYLNLADNNISGTIPHCFAKLSGMIMNKVELESGDNDYSVMSNNYHENILAYMKGRQLLYTMNSLMPFPLTFLDLSSNNIFGEIPNGLMNLDGLKSLNLSRNMLKGEIPMTIGNLTQIESLDLSMNKLSGRIPQTLTSLNFLSYLNLSFNNLTGPIPVGNQLRTLDNPSIYEGNSGVCGPSLSSCVKSNSSYKRVGEDKDQDDIEGMWFLFGMGSGFAAGFIGILGSLHFIRSWRVAYFKILESVFGWLMLSILLNCVRVKRKLF